MATYTFDCPNRVIQLTDTGILHMDDLYSRWKDEFQTSLSGCDLVMRVVKEPLVGATFLGPYYFMMNDWQIRPVNSSHELLVEGTILQDVTSSLTPFKVDDLTSSVSIVRQVAVEVQIQEIEGVDSAKIDAIKERTDRLPDSPSSTGEVFGSAFL